MPDEHAMTGQRPEITDEEMDFHRAIAQALTIALTNRTRRLSSTPRFRVSRLPSQSTVVTSAMPWGHLLTVIRWSCG
jgi:hypothetical protein